MQGKGVKWLRLCMDVGLGLGLALGLGLGLGLLGGCATPCGAPDRLCAPIVSLTSAPEPAPAPAPQAAPQPGAGALAAPAPETFSVASPDAPSAGPANGAPAAGGQLRIALLLPLRSATLGAAAAAVRAGFMAAHERDGAGILVSAIETGDDPQQILESYRDSLTRHEMVVGPLSRSGVAAVANSAAVDKPTVALNYPEPQGGAHDAAFPSNLLMMGLSMEDEARQVAQWAASEHPTGTALILSSAQSSWQRRLAQAFDAHWRRSGQTVHLVEMNAPGGMIAEASLAQLALRVQNEAPALVFAALDAGQLRQVRAALGNAIPIYGTSSLNPGNVRNEPRPELDGVRLFDLPWQLQPDHASVMVYPRAPEAGAGARAPTPDMERLYALGIDAFRVAREIALGRGKPFKLDGVTGRLSVRFGAGPARFERIETRAVFQGGQLVPVSDRP